VTWAGLPVVMESRFMRGRAFHPPPRNRERVDDPISFLEKCQTEIHKIARPSKSALLAVDSTARKMKWERSEHELKVKASWYTLICSRFGEGSQLLMSLFNYTKQHCWPCDTGDGSRSVGWKAPHMSAAGTKETKFNRVNQSRHTISEC
jgi:hypothetical protein